MVRFVLLETHYSGKRRAADKDGPGDFPRRGAGAFPMRLAGSKLAPGEAGKSNEFGVRRLASLIPRLLAGSETAEGWSQFMLLF